MAPETFDEGVKGQLVSPASDVYMLGSCFVELATGCERTPFDWLTVQRIVVFRGHDSTRHINCIQVRNLLVRPMHCCPGFVVMLPCRCWAVTNRLLKRSSPSHSRIAGEWSRQTLSLANWPLSSTAVFLATPPLAALLPTCWRRWVSSEARC